MDSVSLPTDVKALQRLLLQTQAELNSACATIEEQHGKLAAAQQQIVELLRAMRGKQRERIDPDQLLLFQIGELEKFIDEQGTKAEEPARRRKRKRGRRLIPDDAPREEVFHELLEEDRLCPHDGQPMPLIRYEESEQLEYVPPKVKVLVHKRAVYACPLKHDDAKLVTAPEPPQPIEKGLAAPGLLSAMVVGKFGDHLPGYRLEDILSRHGVEIPRNTIYGWLASVAELVTPIVELMKQRVLQSKVIHTDDTQVKLIDRSIRSTRLARFWAYIGDPDHPYTIYDFTKTRQRAGPQAFLKDYAGYLQADAYGGYDGIYVDAGGKIKEVACWAHCRRYWWKAREHDAARSHHVLALIGRLYEIERATGEAEEATIDRDQLQSLRAEHAAPILTEFQHWLDTEQFLPKSQIGKAATYTRNQWEALNRYLEDGALSIDNNLAERAMKNVAIGRKAWLFVGSTLAGERAANLMSLIASCKANRVEPWAYLRDIFTQLPLGTDPERLLPDQWLMANPNHRWTIADRRAKERKKIRM